ncbi:MAG: hypothetical protein FVQ81_11965 [Candidatus Glassbacteria bacterium]|nr:hypothetical protein [Candidatus Glassbacteria bacterium]
MRRSGNRENFSTILRAFLLAGMLCTLASGMARAADSLAIKIPLGPGRGVLNSLGFKPYKPLLTVKTTVKSSVEYDIESGVVVETITLPTQSGELVLEAEYWSVLEYLKRLTDEREDSLFNAISSDYVSGAADARIAQDRGLMPEINLPDFMPKSLASIIGEGTGSLRIHGSSVTEVSGTTTFQIPEDQSLFRQQSKFPRLKLEQRQQINIEGTIGTKINIFVDYNSQNQFENRNRIEVRYRGEQDEILQSIELGDVNLSLPPSMLVAASIPRGNFGIKGETRLGALTTTFIASQEEGESSQKNIRIPVSGQAEATDSLHLWDVNFSRNRHFLLVDTSAIKTKHIKFLDRGGAPLHNASDKPRNIRVFKDDGNARNNNQGFYQARPGIAHINVQDYMDDRAGYPLNPDPNDEFGFFNEMELNRDYILEECGIVISFSWVNDQEKIGVIFETAGDSVGMIVDDTLHMMMIKSEIMTSQNPVWPRMLRNVYTFGGGGSISATAFDIDIFTNETPPRYDESGAEGKLTFLEIFGLDNDGDTRIDRIYVDFMRGLIFFPSLEPFNRPYNENQDLFGLNERNQRMYTEDDPSRLNTLLHQKYQMVLRYSRAEGSQARTFELGAMQIIENSERIYVNDRLLRKGTDYSIDYQFGQLTLNPSVDIPPNSEVKVDFEEVPLFQTGSTSLFGFHNEYGFDPNRRNYLTSTLFYQSVESVDRTFVRLGDEPKTSLLGEFGGKFEFDSEKVTEWLNWLPNLESRTPSRFNIVGGVAISSPNPNTRGGVLIEDFETAKIENPRLNMIYQSWKLSSVPKDTGFEPERAGGLFWFDPYFVSQTNYGFYEQDVYGEIEGRSERHRQLPVDVMSAVFNPRGDNVFDRRQSWRSFVQVVSRTGILGMDEREVLQVYIATGRDQGKLIIDFGQVNEDQVRFDRNDQLVGVNRLDTEDRNFDGRLDIGEDTGLDGVAGADGQNVDGDDGNDDFYRPPYDQLFLIPDALGLNRTEGNNKGQIGENFDTEDLNSNGALDQTERVFRVKLDLEKLEIIPPDGVFIPQNERDVVKDHVEYIYDDNGGRIRDVYVNQLGEDDWYLLEIPLPREGTRFEDFYEKVNSPSLSKILHVRLTFYDFDQPDTVNFANISFVGNRFKRSDEGVVPRLSETFVDTTYSDTLWPEGESSLPEEQRSRLSAAGYHGSLELVSVNTILNNEYYPPPAISATLNKFNRSGREEDFTAQEAAVALNFNDLQRGYEGWSLKAENNQQSYLDYASMTFFVNGRQGPYAPKPTFFIRLGTDRENYYEYSMPVDTGWTGVTVPFDGWLTLKDSLQSALSLAQIQQFDLDVKRGPFRIKGNPSLTKISIMSLGVANESSDIPLSGTVWVDDVLLTNVIRELGINSRLQVEALLSDLGRFNFSVGARDNKFRNLNESLPTNSQFNYTLGGSINIDRLMPASWGVRIPVNVRKTFRRSLPRFHPGSEDVTIKLPESMEQNKTEVSSKSFSASYSKSRGETLLSRMLLNNLNGTMSYTSTRNIAPRSLSSSVNSSGRLRYRTTLPREADVPVFPARVFGVLEKIPLPYFLKYNTLTKGLANARFRYMPDDIELGSSMSYRENQRYDQVSRNFRLDSLFTMNNNVDVNYRPFQTAQVSYDLEVTRNLKETARASKVLGFGYGNEIERRQNVRLQLSPKSLPWLVPQYRYTAGYNNDHSPQYVRSFPEDTDYRKFDTRQQQQFSLRFSIPQFRQSLAGIKFRDPDRKVEQKNGGQEGSSGAAYRRRGRGQQGKGQEPGSFIGKYLFRPVNHVLDSFDPLIFQSSFQRTDRWERMPRNPGFMYQIGLEDLTIDERLRTFSEGDSTVVDTALFTSLTWNFNHTYGAGMHLFGTRFNFNYSEQGSNSHTLNGYQITRSSGPELSFDYSNIWLPYFIRGVFNQVSLASGYQLRKSFRGNSVKIRPKNPLGIDSESREEQWNPKYRVTANLGKTGSVRTRYQRTASIKTDILAEQDRRQITVSNDDNFNLTYSFSAPNGINFPILRRFKLKSNVRTSIDLRRRVSRNFTEVIDKNTGEVTEILINRDTEDITITPTLGYDFSQVIGNLSASYSSHKDRKSGTTRITITMKMSIRLDF